MSTFWKALHMFAFFPLQNLMILGIIGVVPRAEGRNSFTQPMGCAQPSPSACTWHAPFLKDNHGVSIFKHQS